MNYTSFILTRKKTLLIFSFSLIFCFFYGLNVTYSLGRSSDYTEQAIHTLSYDLTGAGKDSSTTQNKNEAEAQTLMFEAITFMNEGNYSKGLEYIEQALTLDSNKIEYHYEQALAYYKLKNYEKAISILEILTYDSRVNDNTYQLLAASYDFLGKKDEVFRVLRLGLEKFPQSGRLYYERGVAELGLKQENDAIQSWEQGVNYDPAYGNNYYQLVNNYKNTDNKLWAILYSEVFLNISQSMSKSQEISKVLYNLYSNNIYEVEEKAYAENSGQKVNTSATNGKATKKVKSYPKIYSYRLSDETTAPQVIKDLNSIFNTALNNILNSKNGNKYIIRQLSNEQVIHLNLEGIVKFRQELLTLLQTNGFLKQYPIYILSYLSQMAVSGNLTAYSYLLLAEGTKDSEPWVKKNSKVINNYVKWQETHHFNIEKNNNYTKLDAKK